MRTFDPAGWRAELKRTLIGMETARRREDYLPNAVGSAARAGVDLCVYAWLVGLRREVAPILAKYRDWLADAVARNESFGQPPAYFAAMRLEALALAGWMLDGVSDPTLYRATLPLYEETWAAESAGLEQDGLPDDVDDYLRNCVLAEVPEQGMKLWSRFGSGDQKGATAGHETLVLAQHICRANWGRAPADAAGLDLAGRVLAHHLADSWLARGQALRAALWLKAGYFVGGVEDDPEATLLRAYVLMPGIVRPPAG
ncbi:MAG: hypothetical protein FIA97_15800 [Methylococcaceae bacterium]|nr:hypothetical protein [Methylococcaceae bacterium]